MTHEQGLWAAVFEHGRPARNRTVCCVCLSDRPAQQEIAAAEELAAEAAAAEASAVVATVAAVARARGPS